MSYIKENICKADILNRLYTIDHYRDLLRKELDVYVQEHCPFNTFPVVTIRDARLYNFRNNLNFVGREMRVTGIKAFVECGCVFWEITGVVLNRDGSECMAVGASDYTAFCPEGDEREWMIKP